MVDNGSGFSLAPVFAPSKRNDVAMAATANGTAPGGGGVPVVTEDTIHLVNQHHSTCDKLEIMINHDCRSPATGTANTYVISQQPVKRARSAMPTGRLKRQGPAQLWPTWQDVGPTWVGS